MPDEMGVEHALVHAPGGGNAIVTSLIESIASVHDVEPTALPPLQETLDTDALVALLDSTGADDPTIEFVYAGCRVTVGGGGLIQIRNLAGRG